MSQAADRMMAGLRAAVAYIQAIHPRCPGEGARVAPMKMAFCDLCGQQLTEAEAENNLKMPSERGTLTMSPIVYVEHRERLDVCWRCLAERLLAVAPLRRPAS
jgi:hypothetical protein